MTNLDLSKTQALVVNGELGDVCITDMLHGVNASGEDDELANDPKGRMVPIKVMMIEGFLHLGFDVDHRWISIALNGKDGLVLTVYKNYLEVRCIPLEEVFLESKQGK